MPIEFRMNDLAKPSSVDLDEVFSVPFKFAARLHPIPADTRKEWRVALVVLLVDACHGAKATISQLHVLNWGVLYPESREELSKVLRGEGRPESLFVRYDPVLDRAIDLAAGMNLVAWTGAGRLVLEDSGRTLLRLIKGGDIMSAEKAALVAIGRKLTLALASQIVQPQLSQL
jgi:hypothetical protein